MFHHTTINGFVFSRVDGLFFVNADPVQDMRFVEDKNGKVAVIAYHTANTVATLDPRTNAALLARFDVAPSEAHPDLDKRIFATLAAAVVADAGSKPAAKAAALRSFVEAHNDGSGFAAGVIAALDVLA